MVTELAGAKILTPFFGASLYSWASTLSITLLALMTGYYSGGYATTKARFQSADKITWIFFLSGLTVSFMPSFGHFIMQKTIALSFFPGLIISELLFLLPPIFLMGMISPMIIYQITSKAEQSGRSAGNIYAISTCGGILFTLIFGFLVIPYYGISTPVRLLGMIMSVFGIILLLREKAIAKKLPLSIFLVLLFAALGHQLQGRRNFPSHAGRKMLECSEGLLGELKVTDEINYQPDGKAVYLRALSANNIVQNSVFAQLPTQSVLPYVNFSRQVLKLLPDRNSALLLGLGAGSIYKALSEEYRNVETVEIDKRIYDLGIKYFGMPPHEQNHITDGRYFLNTCRQKYNLIMIDAIIGESVPGQMLTVESFKTCAALLQPNGVLLIENGGLKDMEKNSMVPSVFRSLLEAGFQVHLYNPLRSLKYGDVLFIATKNDLGIDKKTISDDVLLAGGPMRNYEVSINSFDTASACLLTDDLNRIDILLKTHYFTVRKDIRKSIANARL